ncbi:ATP-dependent metallopeptidase FtsH/Yme1/Tma family protein [Methylibium petroleiphilum]|uniref:Putative cell division protein n=1 Tax=Methylibium petroleiphilum (strain ATCC BAA-1232 / LMG 22953 / PM1) TaxID=420662 RepID=A2SND3_METPP|nr:AAA family ATPase [Methylibium petroleiphilum]ABM97072.1 putative cell division protein [Methylibium petroleiphilum PM1]
MSFPTRLLALLKRRRGPLLAALAIGAALLASNAVERMSEAESLARKSPAAAAFEKAPDDWVKNPRPVSDFQLALEAGSLADVGIASGGAGTMLLYTLKDGTKLSALVPGCTAVSCAGTAADHLAEKSAAKGFTLVAVDVDWRGRVERIVAVFQRISGPALWIAGVALVMLLCVQIQARGDDDRVRLAQRPRERFDDVVGAGSAKSALLRVGRFMEDPAAYLQVGARAPRGVLMTGPSGTGKTLLAKALAGETGARFIAVDGSYFTSMFFGLGVLKVRKLFRQARRSSPCILFVDEIDGIGRRSSGAGQNASTTEMNRIINCMLVEMDGFSDEERVIVVAATNHADNLDPALRRAGRFDMVIPVDLPTVAERAQLFDLYAGRVAAEPNLDTAALARMTSGMSPADIANAVNKAASCAAEAGSPVVTQEHLTQAVEAFQLGGEVTGAPRVLTEDTRKRLAYHEAGHALVAHRAGAGNVERVSIEPRGGALGATYVSRDNEDPLYAEGELSGRLAMLLGGREAELAIFGDVSSGASDDLRRATELAISMVSTLGFSPNFGLLSMAGVPKELLGPQTQEQALQEARELLSAAQRRAREILTANASALHQLAAALLEREIVGGEPLRQILSPSPQEARAA